jgi:hypothetical protein
MSLSLMMRLSVLDDERNRMLHPLLSPTNGAVAIRRAESTKTDWMRKPRHGVVGFALILQRVGQCGDLIERPLVGNLARGVGAVEAALPQPR